MAWEPKDPWGGSGQDPLDEALRKAQDQLTRLVPGRGFKSIIYIVLQSWLSGNRCLLWPRTSKVW